MTRLLQPFLFSALALHAWGQAVPEVPGQDSAQTSPQAPEVQTPQKSTLKVEPGPEVIKNKDRWDSTGWFHPFVRMPKYFVMDQAHIWSSPFRTSKKDSKYWAIFGAATVGLIATDKWTVKQLPNSSSQVSVSNVASQVGAAQTLIPVSAAFYLLGTGIHQDRIRETGLMQFEALLDATIVVEVLKLVADRARPNETNGTGRFQSSPGARLQSGFPSGHAISSWAMASVVAHEYPHKKIVPILAYGLATTVVVARVGARKHFPGDVVAGSAMGWFIGDFIYGRRHNRDLDHKPTLGQKILDHVTIGASIE